MESIRVLTAVFLSLLLGCMPAATPIVPHTNEVLYMERIVALEQQRGTFNRRVMEAAMREHIAFIEATTTLRHTNGTLPRVEIWPPWQVMHVGGDGTLGMHDKGVIILPANFTHEADQGYGVLVHELVHYLQHINNIGDPFCQKKAEVLAYSVSNAWVRAHPSSVTYRNITSAAAIRSASAC